jgi:hypothetical protein
MAAGASHAIRARSGMVMALYLLPRRESPETAG